MQTPVYLASHAGVFRGARISSLPTNACPTEDNIPFPPLANHVVLSKFWKVDLDCMVTIITRSAWNFKKPSWPLINVSLRAAKVRFTQSDFRILCALHNLSERKKRRKKVTLGSRSGSRFFTITSLWVMFSLSTLYLKTVDWSLTTRMQQWERNVVLCWAGVCGEGRNTSSPKNDCVGGYFPIRLCNLVRVDHHRIILTKGTIIH